MNPITQCVAAVISSLAAVISSLAAVISTVAAVISKHIPWNLVFCYIAKYSKYIYLNIYI